MLYRGATVERPVDGMYSFVPARRADEPDPRFPRPAILLPELVNPGNARAAKGATTPLAVADVQAAWEAVRRQVLDADLLLGIMLWTPERRDM